MASIHLFKDTGQPGGGGTCLSSQHSGGKDRWNSVSSRPTWSMRACCKTGSKATEKPCLEKQNKTKTQSNRMDTKPSFCNIQETHLKPKDGHYLRVKGWEKIIQSNGLRNKWCIYPNIGQNRLRTKINQKRWIRAFHMHHRESHSRRSLNSNYLCPNYRGPTCVIKIS